MTLDVLPDRTDGAAANMAADFLLLQRYPHEDRVRFRHYGWHRPAFSFGYSQKITWVRGQVAEAAPVDLVRRPTGGGLVDHREDWTYTVVLPRGHVLAEARAVESYRAIHEALAEALRAAGAQVELQTTCEPPAEGEACGPAGVCFQRAERFDLVHATSREKVAGAAQKRSKRGLLLQGSVARAAVGAADWAALRDHLVAALSARLGVEAAATGWPDFDEELSALTESYAAPEWLEQR